MAYLEKRIIKGRPYHYLVKNIRIGRKWKKIRVYIGSGGLSKEELLELMEKKSKTLENKVQKYAKSNDPMMNILSNSETEEIEKIRKTYASKLHKMDELSRKNYFDWFLATFTYNTNAIEGSTIKHREAAMILFEGMIPAGRTVREVKEVENHKEAFDIILSYKGDVNKSFILKLHKALFHNILGENAGVFRKVQVFVRGAEEIPPRPEDVERDFSNLIKWYKFGKKKYNPVIVASYMHCGFEGVHPFIDGNGRVGRLLLNFILMKNGLPPIDIKNKRRLEYYEAIRKSLKGDLKPFVEIVMKYLKENVLIDK